MSQLASVFARTCGSAAMALIIVLGAAVDSPPSRANDMAEPVSIPDSLAEIGMAVEPLLSPTPTNRSELERMAATLDAMIDSELSDDERGAAHFLSGEIRYALGDYLGAEEFFRKAEKARGRLFADDAAIAGAASKEASGQIDDAHRDLAELERDAADGSLLPEIRLARCWNALRRGHLSEAEDGLNALRDEFIWMEDDPRVALLAATIAYHHGSLDKAITFLGETQTTAASVYLRAMCLDANGDALRAAAAYQDVTTRFPNSGLADEAMLAKAGIFLASGAYRSAAEEYAQAAANATDAVTVAEAALRHAVCVFLDGDASMATGLLRDITEQHAGTDFGARAQFLLGEVLFTEESHDEAIIEFSRVLTQYFQHSLAARAQYRIGRSLDALGRQHDATSTYEAVVSGYSMAPEAPAAAYLAGVGLLEQGQPLSAANYFQLVLDRYAQTGDSETYAFASPEHQELVEAALCLLMLSYHRAGDLGQLSGAPHLMLEKMPPSRSEWRAHALLIDADALASQGRYADAQSVLEDLINEYPETRISVPANRLLAWVYAQQGHDDLAIEIEQSMLSRYGVNGGAEALSGAHLNKAHILFNRKQYQDAAEAYEQFLISFPGDAQVLLALYQVGLCYVRLDRNGDAVDRWEEILRRNPTADIAEQTWLRAGDLYFRAERFDDAKRCYAALLEHFPHTSAAETSMLRLAHCEYNQGRDAEALEAYSRVTSTFPETSAARDAEQGMERALYRLGQREDSATVLAELVARYPTSSFAAEAQFEIATRLLEEERFAEAAEEYRRVVSQFPSYPEADRAQYLMADSYARAGMTKDARGAYEQFSFLFPDSELRSTVQFRLGSIRFDEGDYMRAAINFTGVMDSEAEPETRAAAIYNLALCHRALGDVAQSMVLLEQVRSDPNTDPTRMTDVNYQLGLISEESGQMEAAITEYERAVGGAPTPDLAVELHYRLGSCRERLGSPEAALLAYERAASCSDKEHPYRLSALARCAMLYEEEEDWVRAVETYRDLGKNAADPELISAATERAAQLETIIQ